MKTVPFYFLILIIASCSSPLESKKTIIERLNTNPLDSILGDKIIDEKTKTVRSNNFEKLLSLTQLDLEKRSDLYSLKPLQGNFKLLTQKKTYSEARNFDIILKLKEEIISEYFVFNDSRVEGVYQDSSTLFLLTGDFDNHNIYWNSENKISLLKFDDQLNQLWKYTTRSKQYPLRAVGLRNENNQLVATIEIITGCHICANTFELRFNDKGNCISAIETNRTNSTVELDSAVIARTFIK